MTVTNGEAFPVAVTVAGAHGSKTFEALAGGRSASRRVHDPARRDPRRRDVGHGLGHGCGHPGDDERRGVFRRSILPLM